ncbi:MAG: DDE-type integrase/transposase/recombinase, partial [Gammaproteobacteria bacterium]|nr:DDE-type integrase/transposase/recombinase [Gammaproteobacteria bacterium]
MDIKLHKLAKTTPATRAYIQRSSKTGPALARELGISLQTVYKWKHAGRVLDGSHARHHQNTSTSPEQQEIVRELRQRLNLSLDDIVEVMNRCFAKQHFSRSSIYSCLRRLELNRRPKATRRDAAGSFEQATCGFIHIDLKVLCRLDGKASYVFVAIDRATRYVQVQIVYKRDAKTMERCLRKFLAAFPHPVHTILTDNDGAFTDKYAVHKKDKPKGKPSGRHPFDLVCQAQRIEHRLIRPWHPRTNGMVERFNRRISEAVRSRPDIKSHHGRKKFRNHEQRNAFIQRFVENYNRTRLKCLDYQAPIAALQSALNNQSPLYIKGGVMGRVGRRAAARAHGCLPRPRSALKEREARA